MILSLRWDMPAAGCRADPAWDEFHACHRPSAADIRRFDNAKEEIRCLNLGGTANIGTGLNADVQYFHRVVKMDVYADRKELVRSYDLIDAQHKIVDSYASRLKVL